METDSTNETEVVVVLPVLLYPAGHQQEGLPFPPRFLPVKTEISMLLLLVLEVGQWVSKASREEELNC